MNKIKRVEQKKRKPRQKKPIENKRYEDESFDQIEIDRKRNRRKKRVKTADEPLKKRPKVAEQERKNQPRRKKNKKRRLTKQELQQLKKKKRKENIIEIIKFILPIIVFAALVFVFILNTSPHMVDGNSMKPTLLDGERVIVRRTKQPQRYEIITFQPPVDSEFQYVKRVIGMPGDMIWTEGSDLFINPQAKTLPKLSENSAAKELPDGTIKINLTEESLEQLSQFKKIPKGYYFVLGDNRDNSSDSRSFGLVTGNAIEGVVSFRYTPFSRIGWIK
ncbi:signal peptidase I [Enterococcus sp. UD-01]|jgi:signal peptidase I|uniref:signal peptidase I n=1 Tax=Enterococcus sp. UD-01 TaxID=3373911 RepID=UPI003835E917